MLSPALREGADVRTRSSARALALCLALAGSLAAAPAAPPPAGSSKPASGEARTAPAPSAPADPDTTLHRLAEEAAQIDPSSPEALARLRAVLRDLIDVERATRRELAALRAEVTALRTAGSRRTAASNSRPGSEPASAAGRPPVAGGTAAARTIPAAPASAPATTPVAGSLFGKRGLKRVHRPGCTFGERIRSEERVSFGSLKEAAAAGYEACKVCRPE